MVEQNRALLGVSRLLICVTLFSAVGSSSFAAPAQSGPLRPREIPSASLDPIEDETTKPAIRDAARGVDDTSQRTREARTQELARRISFLKWVHVDGLWVRSSNRVDAVGVIGTHLVIANIGRLYIYGPPGVMLIRQRTGREWMFRPALTWGFSFYLTEFTVPGSQHRAQLFANITRVWTEGDQRNGMDMVGLSVTWKK